MSLKIFKIALEVRIKNLSLKQDPCRTNFSDFRTLLTNLVTR